MTPLLRRPLLAISRSSTVKGVTTRLPLTREVVARFVAGETAEDAVAAARALVDDGLLVTLDVLGEDTREPAQAERAVTSYLDLLQRLADAGLSAHVEVSVKLSAIGQALPDGEAVALAGARRICRAARNTGTTMTLDMEDHTTTDSTLRVLQELRKDFPESGAVLQAYLRRTEADCRALTQPGSRVRLCKGAYDEPADVAFQDGHEVDRSYARCLRILMEGHGYPMVATHDPRLVAIAEDLVARTRRACDSYEFQMLYGVRPHEQRRLAAAGHRVRVYVPFGAEWYGYLVRRLAERPGNVAFFLRALASRT
jgi:proline dehydrogenase